MKECIVLLTVDAAGTVLSVHPEFEEVAGFSRYAVLGKRVAELRNGPDARLFRLLESAVRNGGADPASGNAGCLDEGYAVLPLVDPLGRIAQFVAIRRIEEEPAPRERASDRQRSPEQIGRMVGSFAHHFNNLLTPIIGNASLIVARTRPGDPARAPAESIVRSGEKGASMIRKLLAFARRIFMHPAPFDINALVVSMEPGIREVLPAKVDLKTHLAPSLLPVHADPDQTEWLLMELVLNGCEAMPRGGHLSIQTAAVDFDRPGIRQGVSIAPGAYVVLSVRDSGIGMDADTRALLFEPFFTTKPGSFGLGLSSIHGIVKQAGGYIWVDGKAGKGTAVTIYLPRRPETEAAETAVERVSEYIGR